VTSKPQDEFVVTGGAWFIGSNLVRELLGAGAAVRVIDDLSSGDQHRIPDDAEFSQADIVEAAQLGSAVRGSNPRAIFHLAAQSSVTRSMADPVRDCLVNVTGTLNVLRAAADLACPVVFTSTGGALYGDDVDLPTTESAVPAPASAYGGSKWAAEALVATWRTISGLPHTVCRLGNVYGPGQSPHGEAGVVAILACSLWRDDVPTLFGWGKPTRDYVHVADIVAGLVAAVGIPGTFNLSTGIETSVDVIFEHLRMVSGRVAAEAHLAPLRPGELRRSCMDPGLAHAKLGWQASIGLEAGIMSTYPTLLEQFRTGEARP
jgi:UDP-glucose 4-epimerase